MSRISNSHTVSIATATTVLGQQAAQMVAGEWRNLTSLVTGLENVLGPAGQSSIEYGNAAAWNPISKVIEFVGKEAGPSTPWRHMRYVDSSGSFVLVDSAIAQLAGQNGHIYDHVSVNPANGDLYFRQAGSTVAIIKPFGSSTFSGATPAYTGLAQGFLQIAIGTCWWSGSFTGGSGFGAHGGLIEYQSGAANGDANAGVILGYNPLTNAWAFNASGMAPFTGTGAGGNTYHSVAEYSSILNCAVYGGGDQDPRKVFRLNSNGAFTALDDVPTGKTLSQQQGILTVDPVTGKFLFLGANGNAPGQGNAQLWELNPNAAGGSQWTQQTGGRAPPAGSPNPSGGGSSIGCVGCSISTYGVVAFITKGDTDSGSFWLYKHA